MRNNDPVVVTRACVLISSARLCGPLLMLGIGFPFDGKLQLEFEGRPDPHARETDSGNPEPVGVTFTVNVAGSPAFTVALAGLALILKSFTVALPLIVGVPPPGKLRNALFPIESGPDNTVVGAVTVTVTEPATFSVGGVAVVVVDVPTVPRLQITVPPLGVEQVGLLPLTLAEADLMVPEPGAIESLNTTPETGSPVLKM